MAKGVGASDLDTVPEIFTNATLPTEPARGPFGVCYVAYAGTHDRRYRGERLLEVAARQLRAAAAAADTAVPQCLLTDQPERPRPYIDLILPLRSSADGAPLLALCPEYSRRFQRPCKLFFGYMVKAMAALQAPYELTVFLDTDTFVCSGALLSALPRLASGFDLLLSMPRTSQGWVNSGVLVVRRHAVHRWGEGWLREFPSLDDFGDQLHLLKVLPRAAGLSVGELPPELHLRHGAVADADAIVELQPALRGPVLLLHSKGLASLTHLLPFLAARPAAESRPLGGSAADAARAQLASAMGDGQPEPRKKGEKQTYSSRTLAGLCLLLLDGGRPTAGARWAKRWVINTNGSCAACAQPPPLAGAVGAVLLPAQDQQYACAPRHGSCGIRAAAWPDGTEARLPAWFRAKRAPTGDDGRT